MTFQQIGDLINSGGVVLLLFGALYGGYKGWWVWGSQYQAVTKDRDEWKDRAMRGANLAEKAVTVASAVVTPGPLREP